MRGKIFATVAAILALCLTCAGCFDSDEPDGGKRTRTKTESANVVPNDECAQVLALYLDQQLLFKNEATKHAPAYFIAEDGSIFNPPATSLFLTVASKDCLTASLRAIELCSSLAHSRYLTYEQIAQIADKFADLQKRCSYKIECAGKPNVPTDNWPKYLQSAKVYNVTITAPDMAAIEQSIFNNVKSEYLSKLPAADKEAADFSNYYDMIIFNERDLVHLGSYRPPGHHEASPNPLNPMGLENPQDHPGVLWVHYAVDRDVVGKIVFDQFMNTLEKPELPTRKIELNLLLAPYHDDRIPKICTLVKTEREDFEAELPRLVWQNFGKTFSAESGVFWNRSRFKTRDGKPIETIFSTRLGMYVSKDGEDSPHAKDTVVTDGNQKFRGVELENVSVAVCDVKDEIIYVAHSYEPDLPIFDRKEITVTLLVDNQSDQAFVSPWARIIDEYGDELRSYSSADVKPHTKEKVTITADTGYFFTNELSYLCSDMMHANQVPYGWQKHTAGYDPNTETLIKAYDSKKKFADLKKWQEANRLHAYDLPKNYFVKYGRLLIPLKISSAD